MSDTRFLYTYFGWFSHISVYENRRSESMEQLLRKSTVQLTELTLDKQEDCPVSGEYTLPEYCPDVAVVLKCFADPRIQNRQWSGDQLLIDGNAVIRVLYLDEERRCVRALEFTLPFSCAFRGNGFVDNAAVELDLATKYLNYRAVSPRRIEVRGAVVVTVRADGVVNKHILTAEEGDDLYTRTETIMVTVPCGSCDKVLSISESVEFDSDLPPAEMLLGGECHAAIHECKLLSGKAIVKGYVYIRQLYMDNTSNRQTHCLNYKLPFSQIMDVANASETMLCKAFVHVLTDTERCSVGPDGENTILDVNAKLLIQVQVYQQEKMIALKDAYHRRYPLTAQTEELEQRTLLGTRWEAATLSMKLAVPNGEWSEIIDVSVQTQPLLAVCTDGKMDLKGKMEICVVARDVDGEIVCEEYTEEYGLEYGCAGNFAQAKPTVTDWTYHVAENRLELQVKLCVCVSEYESSQHRIISELRLEEDKPYPRPKVSTLFYYAESGESVWDIGRLCHASPDCILSENAMDDEFITENTVIVVPIMH